MRRQGVGKIVMAAGGYVHALTCRDRSSSRLSEPARPVPHWEAPACCWQSGAAAVSALPQPE